MPLSHALSAESFVRVLQGGALLSQRELRRRGLVTGRYHQTVEERLETDASVFTYCRSFSYPETSCGILFRPELETTRPDEGIATPFDSGSTEGYLLPRATTATHRAFIRKHEMPAPMYREALALTLSHCYPEPSHYLSSTPPAVHPPIPCSRLGDERQWIFEVRWPESLQIDHQVLAIFVPQRIANQREVARKLADLQDEYGIQLVQMPSSSVDDWVHLRQLGAEFVTQQIKNPVDSLN
jgi:hypothetical protein